MGIIVTKNNSSGRLQGRIAAELREKNQPVLAEQSPDFVEDSKYLRDYKKGSRQKWALIVSVVIVLATLAFLVSRMVMS
ncbi:hypothetical protein FWH13_02305 [Candidatus Saccharibacteria bacterium]|nr:hypothetical protein [Candidatus Saccharibacteria bacterium]